MTQPTTHPERTEAATNSGAAGTAAGDAARPAAGWSPRRAWRLRATWGPVAEAAAAVASPTPERAARVLVLGDPAGALEALLARDASRYAVRAHDGEPGAPLPFEDGAFDCAVAVDWLPLVRPSQRERAVADLCRVARSGAVLAGPFHSDETVAAERAVNALVAAATGADHPELGRHLEYGLPDLDAARAWAGAAFAHVAAAPLDDLAGWQLEASLDAAEGAARRATAEEAAAAALLPPVARPGGPAYRTLLVASAAPVALDESTVAASGGVSSLAAALALEAAAQRSALDRLVEAVTAERERERGEFRAAVASLAAELHEREAQVEFLNRSLRERDLIVANQAAAIEGVERRLEQTNVHVANLEAERDATAVHVRNLEADRDMLRRVETEVVGLRALAEEYRAWAESRGGRALAAYVRVKRKLLGKEQR